MAYAYLSDCCITACKSNVGSALSVLGCCCALPSSAVLTGWIGHSSIVRGIVWGIVWGIV